MLGTPIILSGLFFIIFLVLGVIAIRNKNVRAHFICYNYSEKNKNQFYRLFTYSFVPIDYAELVWNALVIPQLFYFTISSIGTMNTIAILVISILVNGLFFKYFSLLKYPIYGSQGIKFTLLITTVLFSPHCLLFIPPNISVNILPFLSISFLVDAILLISRYTRRIKTHYLHSVSVFVTIFLVVAPRNGADLKKINYSIFKQNNFWKLSNLCELG